MSTVAELRRREPRLAIFAIICFVAGVLSLIAALIDPRVFAGVSLWLKPAKFFISIAIFAGTWAWFAGLVDPQQRNTRTMKVAAWALIASGSFELVYITFQAARAEASHFNTGDPVHALLYALMGLGAVILIGSNIPLAMRIARYPKAGIDPNFRRAVIIGLLLTVALGGTLGGYMSAQTGHAVGIQSGHLAMFGWNRGGGDLRVAHFFGMHTEQVLPAIVALAGSVSAPQKRVLLWLSAALWSALTLFVFAQAVTARPFPFG